MKKSNLPSWLYYQQEIESLISGFVKKSGIQGYQSITGDVTNINVNVGNPSSDDPLPKVVVALTDIVDSAQISNAVSRQRSTIGSKIHTQSTQYNHNLVFTIEAVSNDYENCIEMAEVIKKGFKPKSTQCFTYKELNFSVNCELDNYSLDVKESNGKIVDFIASYTLIMNINDEPLESWSIGSDTIIEEIDLKRDNTLDDLDSSDAEFDEDTLTIT